MKLLPLVLLITAASRGNSQQSFPVTQRHVAQALLRHGLAVPEDQISLVASIVAAMPEPQVEVDSLQPLARSTEDSQLRAKVRLVCPQPRSCLPFYAIVTLPSGFSPAQLAATDRAPASPPVIAMRAGSSATLVVDTGQMHLRVPVISLQNGSVGAKIHVTSPDRKQSYTATVISSTLLIGSL